MHGNVYEWCQDYWEWEYPKGLVTDPVGPTEGAERVVRGGSWNDIGRYCRSAYRRAHQPERRNGDLGFRLARGQSPTSQPAGSREGALRDGRRACRSRRATDRG